MGKSKDPFVHQLKILESISDILKKLEEKHNNLKNGKLGVVFRTVIEPNTPAFYQEGFQGKSKLMEGVRGCDFKFSLANPDWVEASSEHGLSFSATMDHAVGTMKFLGKFQKPKTIVKCAYWILETNPMIPNDMAFVQDPENPSHYLLTITKGMHISELITNLRLVEYRMTVMNGLKLEAYKDA
jgi:hypothetical protein